MIDLMNEQLPDEVLQEAEQRAAVPFVGDAPAVEALLRHVVERLQGAHGAAREPCRHDDGPEVALLRVREGIL